MDGSESRAGARAVPDQTGVDVPIVACWSCRGPVSSTSLFCRTCQAVQPPGQADHFRRLGFDVDYELDPALLNQRYFERQRQLHPDRFATRSPRERAISQQQATAINEAYETLKDALRRADYLLHMKRDGATPEGCHVINDLELVTEAMELREALAEAASVESVAALSRQAQTDIERCATELAKAFAFDDLDAASRLTTKLKYLRKLADDCRGRRQQLAAY
jgi:molecular chaperone HscB